MPKKHNFIIWYSHRIIFIFTTICTLAACNKLANVDNNMITLAKVLYAKNHGNGNNYIFDKVEVLDIGKDIGDGLPVKFIVSGMRGFQTQESQPQGWSSNVSVWIGALIESEEKFNDTIVVLYSKDEFGKLNATIKGGMYTINEEQIPACETLLKKMEADHKLAKEKDAQRQAEYAQQQVNEEARRQEQLKLEQLRLKAQIPTKTLKTYRCYNRFRPDMYNEDTTGELVLTDVDASYVHIYPNEPPFKVKVVFEFSNIISFRKVDPNRLMFGLKRKIISRPGDEISEISFPNIATRDMFYDDIINAKLTWEKEHPEINISK